MPDQLDNIREPIPVTTSDSTDEDTDDISKKHAYNELERDRRKAEEEFNDSRQNREQRKEYAEKIFWLVCVWLVALVITVWKVGAKEFSLSDTVIVALISGASVNIIGLMVIVANYLFPKNGSVKNGE